MTKPINYQNQSIPAYSGITINITNPTLNAAPLNVESSRSYPMQPEFSVKQSVNPAQDNLSLLNSQVTNPIVQPLERALEPTTIVSSENKNPYPKNTEPVQDKMQSSYPPQYYLNNYNYIQNGEKAQQLNPHTVQEPLNSNKNISNFAEPISYREEDISSSEGIINELDSRVAEQKELEKNGKKTKIVALTNEYIMSLENYLNNPNTEIRLMASKEILTRLDEDKERHDDAALNALLNKMLQDPEKLVRIAALSAFSSQLASGNDFTVKLLKDIQNNPNSDKEDVLQASESLLKMTTSTEIKYTQAENNTNQQQVEQQ